MKITKEQYNKLKMFDEKQYCTEQCKICEISTMIHVKEINGAYAMFIQCQGMPSVFPPHGIRSHEFMSLDNDEILEKFKNEIWFKNLDISNLNKTFPGRSKEEIMNAIAHPIKTIVRKVLENDDSKGGCGSTWCDLKMRHIH